MKVKFFCPFWGSENLDYLTFLNKVKEAGYDGVEIILPYDAQQKLIIKKEAEKLNLEIITLWGGVLEGEGFEESIRIYEEHLRNACSIHPKFVNIQTGKDYFSFEENLKFIALADEISKETGVKIIHETHRGKFSFAAHITKTFLLHLPDLRITADFSHWCNVAESLLEDQQESVALAISRSDHIHARIGFAEGPQIPDPRTPEWSSTLDVYFKWWDDIIKLKKTQGSSEFSITPEFGPFPYMTMMPYTQQPITSQWDINLFMKNLLTKRYN
tara:strand:- start:9114 stop:9929 length:816 start_codon:yes stop_codon:yes gene_type:complete